MAWPAVWTKTRIKTAMLCIPVFLLLVVVPDETLCSYQIMHTVLSRLGKDNYTAIKFPNSVGVAGGNCNSSRGSTNMYGRMQFMELSNVSSLLMGAMEAVYILDEDTLRCQDVYEWPSNPAVVTTCKRGQEDKTGCYNFLSVYERFPSDDPNENRLLLCGTHAGSYPDCVTIKIEDRQFNLSTQTARVLASDGLITFFPQLGGFGEFRQYGSNPANDTTYFSVGFYDNPTNSRDVGRSYNITFHEVIFDEETKVLTMREKFSIKDDPEWLNFPVEFLQYYKQSYGPNLDFYYIFMRESLQGALADTKESRVMRICQNDPGYKSKFTTVMKARIFCQREVLRDLEYIGSIDYKYDEINAMALNYGGRFKENGIYGEYMYASFSGPIFGPIGTAICVYHSDVTGDYNHGLFEVFRQDVFTVFPNGALGSIENDYFECDGNGRPPDHIGNVFISEPFAQIGEDPLIVLNDTIAVKMLMDKACVVTSYDRAICKNLDVFFLGTDVGKILKITLVTTGGRTVEPAVAEELSLDDDKSVAEMVFRMVGGVKKLYISTNTKLYALPLERCSRFHGCGDCIKSRDPYCVWNNNTGFCETALKNGLIQESTGSTPVPPHIWQNIHTGMVLDCSVLPVCQVKAVAVDHRTIRCMVGCNDTTDAEISTSFPIDSSTPCTTESGLYDPSTTTIECRDFSITNGLGRHTYDCISRSTNIAYVTTLPGPPTAFDTYESCGQTSCQVCVQELVLTDNIDSYQIQLVNVQGNSIGFTTTPLTNYQRASGCVFLSGLTPGESVTYNLRLHNSQGVRDSVTKSLPLLDGEAGPVEGVVASTTNNSVQFLWMAPSVTNGTLLGYSIYVNGTTELLCSSRVTDRVRTITNLLPYTDYVIVIRACNGFGESSRNVTLNVRTKCGIPGPVTNARIQRTSDTLTFIWDTPLMYNGDVILEQYHISHICYQVENVNSNTNSQSEKSYTVSVGISPKTLCCAEISVINDCDSGTLIGLPINICARTTDIIPGMVENLAANLSYVGIDSFVVTWNRPSNYDSPGLTYSVAVTNMLDSRINQTFIIVPELQACMEYVVVITAENTELGSGPPSSITVTTKPGLPPPPENLEFTYDASDGLTLSWVMPSMACSTQNITNFKVSWSCDGFQQNRTTNVIVSGYSINVTLVTDVNFGLCLAVVQSCDSFMRCGPYTKQVSVETTKQRPPRPWCFLHTNLDSSVTVSFLFPLPFISSGLKIEWDLYNVNTSISESAMYPYILRLSNVLDIPTESNSKYVFQLNACNIYGCGNHCTLNFSTKVAPVPPYNIVVENRNSSSVLLTWKHNNSRYEDFLFTISITSSCPTVDPFIFDILGNNYTYQNLCPNENYTVAVRVTDSQVNKSSEYSNFVEFSTTPGIPSAPRYVQRTVNINTKELFITWHTPRELNAAFETYDVKWTYDTPCSTSDDPGKYSMIVSDKVFQFKTTLDRVDFKDIYVCVRAASFNMTAGPWGTNDSVEQGGFLLLRTDGCSTLVIVACIAGLAVLSSVLMVIILSISICQCCATSETKTR